MRDEPARTRREGLPTGLLPGGGLLTSWQADIFALLATLATLGLHLLMSGLLEGEFAAVMFTMPIMLAGYLGGLRSGLVATGASVLLTSYFLLAPVHSLAIAAEPDRWRLVFVVLAGVVISALNEALHRSRRRASAALHEQKVAESALLNAGALHGRRVAGIVDSAMDAVISIDAAQRIVLFNAAAERMFACPAGQALGQPLDRFVPARARAAHAAHVQAFGRTGVTSRSMRSLGALMALRADGVEFPIEASISQIEDGGQPVYTVILRDITERLQAERTLRDSEDRLRAVTENLSEGLVICDTEGQVLHMNPAGIKLHGFHTSAEALRRLPEFADTFELSTLAGEVLPSGRWPLALLLSGAKVTGVELNVRRLDIAWARTLSYSGAVVQYAGGQKMAFLSITDVSEARKARAQVLGLNAELEQRVHERTLQLEAKSRELESFCYSVSHDLKAPLRGIDGYSRLLLEECSAQLGPDGQLFANNVRAATRQMTELIEDLLSYSRQERRSLKLGRVGLRSFVAEQLARRHADLGSVTLTADVADVADVHVSADREALAMALRNLLDNAIKFTAKVDKPTVAVRAQVEGGCCVLTVQDNGAGFDMRFHDRIFEIFQRLHRVEEYPGTGIGLALVRKAAERMGGRVWATSSPGGGAIFHLELVLAPSDAGFADIAAAAPAAAGQLR